MAPIEVTVVTGFLGSGKTTLINRMLADPALKDTAVIVNEFGEIAIDHLLVEKTSENIIEIAGGCLCCTVRGELAETLADLVERVGDGRIRKLDRIIVETTGLADPMPVLHAIQSDAMLRQALRIDRVIATVDATMAEATLREHHEARLQIAAADIVVITKSDVAEAAQPAELRAGIAERSAATILDAGAPDGHATRLLEIDVLSAPGRNRLHAGGHHHHSHQADVSAHVITRAGPVARHAVEGFLDLLRSRTDLNILRIKGLVETADDPGRPLVVHGVRRMLYPATRLERWPERSARGTTLVVIGEGLNGEEIDRLFGAFIGEIRADTPDRAALENNPLAIPGTG
ncbi:MAG: GTP-binding protein [Rhizobiaceae bacterium]